MQVCARPPQGSETSNALCLLLFAAACGALHCSSLCSPSGRCSARRLHAGPLPSAPSVANPAAMASVGAASADASADDGALVCVDTNGEAMVALGTQCCTCKATVEAEDAVIVVRARTKSPAVLRCRKCHATKARVDRLLDAAKNKELCKDMVLSGLVVGSSCNIFCNLALYVVLSRRSTMLGFACCMGCLPRTGGP